MPSGAPKGREPVVLQAPFHPFNLEASMSYSVEHLAGEDIILARFNGEADLPALKEFLYEIVRLAVETGCMHILTDLCEAELRVSVADLYYLPNTIAHEVKRTGGNIYRLKRAFVVSKNDEIWNFYEDVSANRSFSTKKFHDIESAKRWLLSE